MSPRCIAFSGDRRCRHAASISSGDVFVCRAHSRLITTLLIEDRLTRAARRMLARTRWETVEEGRALIAHLHARLAA